MLFPLASVPAIQHDRVVPREPGQHAFNGCRSYDVKLIERESASQVAISALIAGSSSIGASAKIDKVSV